jgi:hypothetical protein
MSSKVLAYIDSVQHSQELMGKAWALKYVNSIQLSQEMMGTYEKNSSEFVIIQKSLNLALSSPNLTSLKLPNSLICTY